MNRLVFRVVKCQDEEGRRGMLGFAIRCVVELYLPNLELKRNLVEKKKRRQRTGIWRKPTYLTARWFIEAGDTYFGSFQLPHYLTSSLRLTLFYFVVYDSPHL